MSSIFKYDKVKEYNYKVENEYKEYKRGYITFTSPFKSSHPENNKVYVEFLEPYKPKFNAIILLHSLYEKENGPTKKLFFLIAKENFGAYLLNLPYHMKRTPKNYVSGQLFLTGDFEKSINGYIQAVIDVCSLVDYLSERKDIENIGIIGISLGSFILNTAMGIDSRLKAGVSILGGGNIHYVFIRSILTMPFVFYGIFKYGLKIRDYKKVTKEYKKYLTKVKEKGVENTPCNYKWFLIDPLTYAHLNNPRNVFMINGYFDLIVPFKASYQLWKELGKPKKLFLPCSHLTCRFFWNLIVRKTINFLKENL